MHHEMQPVRMCRSIVLLAIDCISLRLHSSPILALCLSEAGEAERLSLFLYFDLSLLIDRPILVFF